MHADGEPSVLRNVAVVVIRAIAGAAGTAISPSPAPTCPDGPSRNTGATSPISAAFVADFADWSVTAMPAVATFGAPLSDKQTVRHRLAHAHADTRVARAFLDDCMRRHLAGALDNATASIAKFWCSEMQCRVMDECLQLFGGYGYMMEYPIAELFVDARVQRIYGGTNEIMKELASRSM